MNRSTIKSVGVFALSLVLMSSATTLAQGRGRGQDKAKAKVNESSDRNTRPRAERSVFDSHDRDIIRHYYAGLPPGLAKRGGNLPPGLEKQLQRNGTLPPGLRKHLQPFPSALEHQLAPLPRGYRRGMLDDHLVVYRTDNYTIADFFRR